MAAIHPGLKRFATKFACEIVPASLASVLGATLFAQQWFGPTPPARVAAAADRVVAQNEQIVQMVRDEHDAIGEFLKREQEREIARQPMTIKEVRALAEAEKAAQLAAAAAARKVAEAAKPVPRAKPVEPVQVVAIQSAPVVQAAPAPVPPPPPAVVATVEPRRERGRLGAIVDTTGEWADKVIEVSRVREATAVVREIPSWIISIPEKLMSPWASAETPARFATRY
jgi:hypothetical protein